MEEENDNESIENNLTSIHLQYQPARQEIAELVSNLNNSTVIEAVRQPAPICFKKFPKNFKVLFAFPHRQCNCHNRRLTAYEIFKHYNLNLRSGYRTC
jgi:hypothetical protein